ncbi:MAG: hypothetical protein KTR25_12135 [Myxococcales bacterium]|nr:hypothetical protein [Myxococcales bacterium]
MGWVILAMLALMHAFIPRHRERFSTPYPPCSRDHLGSNQVPAVTPGQAQLRDHLLILTESIQAVFALRCHLNCCLYAKPPPGHITSRSTR